METLILPIGSLLFSLLLLFIFFSKKRIDIYETKIYSRMIVVNFFYSLMAILTFIYAKIYANNVIVGLMQKIYMILMLLLIMYIFIYNLYTLNIDEKIRKYMKIFTATVSIIFFVVILVLPINVINYGNILDGNGLSYNLVVILTIIYFVLIFISSVIIFIRNRNVFSKDIPFIFLIILYSLGLLIRKNYPSIMFENFLFTFMLFIMYFTIENPDLKIVNELLRNKEIVEDQIEDKSRFLFETSQEIKIPTKNIINVINNYDSLNEKSALKIIENNANSILFRLNNVLDISKMDSSKIKISDISYNTKLLFDEIEKLTLNHINDKNISFNINVSKNVPDKLIGDYIRIKQVLMSIIIDCIKNTSSGYIKVKIDAIVRYDVARLIIEIEDSGSGMSLAKINEILEDNSELDDNDINKLNKLDVDLKISVKILKILGGSLNIRSKLNGGTIFTVVIDQNYFQSEYDVFNGLEKYSSDIYGKKRILLVSDNKEELYKASNILSNYNLSINKVMIKNDCINEIKKNKYYNLIILYDRVGSSSALEILNLLKEKGFNIPVIVVVNTKQKRYKKYYIEDGFKDVITKDNLELELKNIVDKYLS